MATKISDTITPTLDHFLLENKPYGIIYRITNTLNKKVYIGRTKKPLIKRWRQHLNFGRKLRYLREENPDKKILGSHFANALAKYDEEVWHLEIIAKAYSKEELYKLEIFYIKKYKAKNPRFGYNYLSGGAGRTIASKNTIEKLRKAKIKLNQDPEYRKRHSESMSRWAKKNWKNPAYRKLRSKISSEIITRCWQNRDYREAHGEKIIDDIETFKKDIIEAKRLTELCKKYGMTSATMYKKFKRHFGTKNFSETIKKLTGKDYKIIRDVEQFKKDILTLRLPEILKKYRTTQITLYKNLKHHFGETASNVKKAREFFRRKGVDGKRLKK